MRGNWRILLLLLLLLAGLLLFEANFVVGGDLNSWPKLNSGCFLFLIRTDVAASRRSLEVRRSCLRRHKGARRRLEAVPCDWPGGSGGEFWTKIRLLSVAVTDSLKRRALSPL